MLNFKGGVYKMMQRHVEYFYLMQWRSLKSHDVVVLEILLTVNIIFIKELVQNGTEYICHTVRR